MSRDERGERVAIIEPRCHGIEHVSFNAALIATTLAACPGANVDVYGEATHLQELEQLLASTRGSSASRLSWHPVSTPPRRAAGWHRAANVRQLFAAIDRAFQVRRPRSVVIATTDPFALTFLKMRLFTTWADLQGVAVFHELLGVLGRRRQSSRRWGFAASLALPHPSRLTYLVLAETIRAHLRRLAPRVAAHVLAIELPSLLGDLPGDSGLREDAPPRLGFVGRGQEAKGFQEFLDLVGAVRQGHPEVHFEVVGLVPADLPRSALAHVAWSDRQLPLVEFVQKVRALSHIIWLGHPKHYQLVASGSLVDAIALGVPVICLSGSLVNDLFERLGEIGIRCDTLADVQREVLSIVSNFSEETYRRQVGAVRAARAALAPEAYAPQLRLALGVHGRGSGDGPSQLATELT